MADKLKDVLGQSSASITPAEGEGPVRSAATP